ncbi:hypothetical protein Pst134EB_012963 [Puccinia striiformis f. sp. tritici]|nr:hypothetical protein Pst134EB_012963 [Puccinia striiformis f. sp. tritici]
MRSLRFPSRLGFCVVEAFQLHLTGNGHDDSLLTSLFLTFCDPAIALKQFARGSGHMLSIIRLPTSPTQAAIDSQLPSSLSHEKSMSTQYGQNHPESSSGSTEALSNSLYQEPGQTDIVRFEFPVPLPTSLPMARPQFVAPGLQPHAFL